MGNLGFKTRLRLDSLPPGTHAKIGSSLKNMCHVDEICTLYTIQITLDFIVVCRFQDLKLY